MTRRLKSVAIIGFLVASTLAVFLLPVSETLRALVTWIRDAGSLGVLVFAAVYIGATVLALPGSALTLGAGFAYGPVMGTLLVSPVSVVAATAAFYLGRTAARPWIAARFADDRRLAAVDRAVARRGLRFVVLLRLSPLFPFSVLNYALGLTSVRARDYILGSLVGMLPGTILYVYLGSLVTRAADLGSHASDGGVSAQRVLYGIGLACSIAVTVWLSHIARRAIREALAEPAEVAR